MKKQLQLITIVVLLASLTGYGQNAGDSFIVDDITYEITEPSSDPTKPHTSTGKVKVVDYGGTAIEVTIPTKVNDQGIDYRVTAIGNEAFSGQGKADEDKLTRVDMPHTVRSIGESAFSDNKLIEVVIPRSVNSIGASAFQDNPDLQTVIIRPDGADGASFLNAPNLSQTNPFSNPARGDLDLLVPTFMEDHYSDRGWTNFKSTNPATFTGDGDGITYAITSIAQRKVEIAGYDASAASSATEVTILQKVNRDGTEYKVTAIGYQAFYNKQLPQVTFSNTPTTPSNVTSIGEDAFWKNGLTSVVIPESVTSLGQRAFGTNQLTEVTLPNGITTISQWAFASNKFTEVTIPAHVDSIEFQAFYGNPLGVVTVERDIPPVLHADAFHTPGRKLIDLVVPIGRIQAYKDNGWDEFRSITFGIFTNNDIKYRISSADEVEIIDYVGTAKEVTIPTTVTDQGTEYKVTAIGYRAFWKEANEKEDGLTRLTFADPSNVARIEQYAFMNNQLTEVTIPSSLTSTGPDVFQNNELTQVNFSTPNRLTYINEGVFKENKLTSVTIPEPVDSIGNSAFSVNLQLTQVTLPGSVTSIDIWAFGSMPIGGTVRLEGTEPPSIEENTFNRSRIDVDVPIGNRQVYLDRGWTGFRSMGIFTDKDIKYGITAVTTNEVKVLDYTGSAAGVDIPGTVDDNSETYTVTSIGQHAFKDNQLTEVTLPVGVTRIDSVAFIDNPNLAIVMLKADAPPTLHADAFQNPGRDQINVIVPRGTAGSIKTAYEAAEWTGFASLEEGIALSIEGASEVESLSPFDMTFNFTREVTGFTINDIDVDHATLSDFTGGGSSYTVKVTPTTCDGVIEITVPENVAEYTPDFRSLAASATVTVNASPSAPAVSSPSVEYCVGETATVLTATGDNLLWYTTATGGTGEATAPTPVTTNAGSTTHYVSQTTNSCESDRAEIVVTVEACPAQVDVFTVSSIDYEITSVDPNEVEVVDYIGSATEVEIPGTVTYEGITYKVTAIGANAFSDNPDLSTVKVKATPPPSIHDDAFADRSQVDLVVPTDMRQAYIDAGWTGFASITEEKVVTAIRNHEFKDFTLYPNPARDKVYIDIDPGSGQKLKQVNIYTMIGAYLYSENGPVINTSRLPRGTYLFEIVTQKGDRSLGKIIIQ